MGGPLWTAPEEEYFWTKVIPFSDKRIGHDQKTQKAEVKTWETLAKEMLEAMTAERAKTGEKPLREYTALTLAEHWDKNVMQDRISKFAQVYVEAYLAEMKQEEGGVRWAKRQRRLGKTLLPDGEDEDDEEAAPKRKKRKLVSSAGTTAQTPSTSGATTIPRGRQTVKIDTTDDDEEVEAKGTLAPAGGPSTELPSIRHLLRGTPPRETPPGRPASYGGNTRRQLFPSGPSGNNNFSGAFGHRANPGTFIDANDNPFQPRQAPVSRREVETLVRDAVEQRMLEINDLVTGDIHLLIQAEVRRQMGSIQALVRDEVARQLSSFRAPSTPMGRSEIDRHPAAASLWRNPQHASGQQQQEAPLSSLFVGGHTPAPAAYPQQQPFSSAGRGGPYSSRPPPAGLSGLPRWGAGPSTARTPLPTARGQFPMSHARSRVGGRGGRTRYDEEEREDEEDEVDEGDHHHA